MIAALFVTVSVGELPVSEVSTGMAGVTGAVASTVTAGAAEAAPVLPAVSVAFAVKP